MIKIPCFEHFFAHLTEKNEILACIVENRVNKEDLLKLSIGEIPVPTDRVDFLNQSGPVRSGSSPVANFSLDKRYYRLYI